MTPDYRTSTQAERDREDLLLAHAKLTHRRNIDVAVKHLASVAAVCRQKHRARVIPFPACTSIQTNGRLVR